MHPAHAFYAQSGGSTAVINASAAALMQRARQDDARACIQNTYVGHNGILGALREELLDTSAYSDAMLQSLRTTPGSAFGSCRYKLAPYDSHPDDYHRLLEVFKAHNIRYFFYNGGGDSQDTAHKVASFFETHNAGIHCIGIPKTIDNDLAHTDCSPGFASAAKYLAVSAQEILLELRGMHATSTQVFILETMGRHTGWLAAGAACGLPPNAPSLVLMPEVAFNPKNFLEAVKNTVEQHGYCMIITSEGIKDAEGRLLCQSRLFDAFGHVQLGGIAPKLAGMISHELGYKYHWAMPDYMQRAARHLTSKTDHDHAVALGEAAVEAALQGKSNIMLTLERTASAPYAWQIGEAPLAHVANQEKMLPRNFIDPDAPYSITQACRDYVRPLLEGEVYPAYHQGLPDYVQLPKQWVEKQCKTVPEAAWG
jgi:ATP-dependent phosphofructokinase / diphosphate-dependent phosphofructokinase